MDSNPPLAFALPPQHSHCQPLGPSFSPSWLHLIPPSGVWAHPRLFYATMPVCHCPAAFICFQHAQRQVCRAMGRWSHSSHTQKEKIKYIKSEIHTTPLSTSGIRFNGSLFLVINHSASLRVCESVYSLKYHQARRHRHPSPLSASNSVTIHVPLSCMGLGSCIACLRNILCAIVQNNNQQAFPTTMQHCLVEFTLPLGTQTFFMIDNQFHIQSCLKTALQSV